MKMASISRQVILDRIRKATGGGAPDVAGSYAGLHRDYVRAGKMGADERIALMIERLREYDAEVVEAAPESLAEAIQGQLAASGRRRFVAPAGLPAEWLAEGFEWEIDRGLSTAEIEQAEGVVTAAFCGIADSGTIVLHHSAAEGRRVHQPAAGLASVCAARQPGGGDAAGIFCAMRRGAGAGDLYLRSERYGGY